MIIYLVVSYYLPHNIIHAGKWCDALRMVIKEGYRHVGFDVNMETFDLEGDDVDEHEDVEDFPLGSFNRHLDEMIASFNEGTPKHHHPQTSGSYTPISPLPPTPQHRKTPQQQQSSSAFNGNPPTPGSYSPISPLPPTPQHRNILQHQQSPLILNGNPPTPGGHSTSQPSPALAQRRQRRAKRPRVIYSPADY